MTLVAEIQEKLAADPLAETDAFRIGLLLAKLTGTLRIHFAQEDRVLYPLMIAGPDRRAAAVAARFQEEMGGLGATYVAFAERWTRQAAILSDVEGFRFEAGAVFAALADRITRENEQLYPLADVSAAREDLKSA